MASATAHDTSSPPRAGPSNPQASREAPASSAMRALFLPEGYPSTVSADYMSYQVPDTLAGLMSYLKGVLCTLSFLRGLGVGDDEVHHPDAFTALQWAMVVWIARDATSMVMGLGFGSPLFTRLFCNPRRLVAFRMLSETLRGVAGCLELLAATAQERPRFIALVCTSATLNAAAGIIGVCTRASLITHFAVADNVADCAIKEANQDKGVKLLGIAGAVAFLSLVGDNPTAAWIAYGFLTVAHLLFNWLAVTALRLDKGKAH